MDTTTSRLLEERRKERLAQAELYLADAERKAKSVKRLSAKARQRARVREVLSSLKLGLIASHQAHTIYPDRINRKLE